jgi:hypothetical protein
MTPKTRPTKNTLPRVIPKPRRCTEMLTRWIPSGSAGAPGHHHRSSVQDQGSPAFRAGRVQGHRRDFLQIQDPLPTQRTSLQDFTQRCCCRCRLAGHHIVGSWQQEPAAELGPLPPTLQEEGSIQGLWGEKGYSPDGDGTPPGCGGGAKHSSADRSTRDRDSSHSAVKCRHHHPRLQEDGRGSGQ